MIDARFLLGVAVASLMARNKLEGVYVDTVAANEVAAGIRKLPVTIEFDPARGAHVIVLRDTDEAKRNLAAAQVVQRGRPKRDFYNVKRANRKVRADI